MAFVVVLSGDAIASAAAGHEVGSTGVQNPSEPIAPTGATQPLSSIATTLTVGNLSANVSSWLWGTTLNNEVRLLRDETNAVNATPVRVIVWPGAMAGEDYDPLTNTHYDTGSGAPKTALTSEVQFVQMCRAIHCTAIVQVPAEIDNASYAEKIVNYTEVTLGFKPAMWMIGNEPELWGHWQVPWKSWGTTYTNGPTPTQFGHEVVRYVKAIRQVDNTTPILGLPASGCTCGFWTFSQWISDVLNVTGPLIQSVAFHEYPAGWLGTGDGSLLDFYGTLQSAANIPIRMASARAAVNASCPKCNVSVFISEIGSALSWSAYGSYAFGFSGALSLASQFTQAMDVNLTNVDLFAAELATSNSWFDPQGHQRPDYALYAEVLNHLGTQAYPVNFTGLSHTVYGIDTVAPADHNRHDLLVVNDNITHAITFVPQFAPESGSAAVAAWNWTGIVHYTASNTSTWVTASTPDPNPLEYPAGLPVNYTLPPQSMILFETYPTGATYVHVFENGTPATVPWYAEIGSTLHRTNAGNISLLLPPGSYPISGLGIPLPIGGKEHNPSERLGAWVTSPLAVAGTHTNTTMTFGPQWRVNLTTTPVGAGTFTPNVGWWDASQPLTVTVGQNPGYAFQRWIGWGPGSRNSTANNITIVPNGRILERAKFAVGTPVEFLETGLPLGTPWSVTIHGFTTNSTSGGLWVYEPNGSYGFELSPVPGYYAIPQDGGFQVHGPGAVVAVRFVQIDPPGLTFPVTFEVTGLPPTTSVPIIVRSTTIPSGPLGARFLLLNGSYSYDVGYVPGYHVNATNKTFEVRGGALVVQVPFVPTVYSVRWEVSGVRAGLNWTVQVNGLSIAATSSWVTVRLPNGSYPYAVSPPPNFSATLRSGMINITAADVTVQPVFSLVRYDAWFVETGLSASSWWTVRLGNATNLTTDRRAMFSPANGTFTYNVDPPSGYYAVPSHGNLTVAGPVHPIVIHFLPSSNKPSAALVAALSATALTVSLWISVSGLAGFGLVRWIRRRGD